MSFSVGVGCYGSNVDRIFHLDAKSLWLPGEQIPRLLLSLPDRSLRAEKQNVGQPQRSSPHVRSACSGSVPPMGW